MGLIWLKVTTAVGQPLQIKKSNHEIQHISIESRIPGLNLSLLFKSAKDNLKQTIPVLFIHGASFPSALAFDFRMNGYSWMDDLASQGYQVFALDHLGYGGSDRYSKMLNAEDSGEALGKGEEVALDIEKAVDYVLGRTGAQRLYLIGHSWGATVSGYYASIHPEQIERLVLFAPFVSRIGTVDWPQPDHPFLELTPEKRVAQFFAQLPPDQDTILEQEVLNYWGETWLASDQIAQMGNRDYVRYPAGWKYDLYNCWSGNCFFEPQQISSPTLIIRGEWDTSFSADDAQWLFENLTAASPKRYVLIERSTHVAHLEKSRDQLYAEVQLFLSEKIK